MTDSTPDPTVAANATVDLAQEAGTGFVEVIIIVVAVLLAGAYLWRTWFGRRRSGCASCGSAKGCAVANGTDQTGCADSPARQP